MYRSTSTFRRTGTVAAALLLCLTACGDPGGAAGADDLVEDPTVYEDVPGGDKTDEVDLRFYVVEGFRLPEAVGVAETRRIFRSAASFRSFVGAEPVGVDFSREHAILYSAGTLARGGFEARITRLGLTDSGTTLKVSTQLVAPGPGCPSEARPDRPYVLVRFTPPAPTPRYVRYYRSAGTAAACQTDPWPACAGDLTDDGIDTIVSTHPRGDIFYQSIYGTYSSGSHKLGRYQVSRWKRTCRGEACEAWAPLPAPPYPAGHAYYHYQSRSLIVVSDVVTYPFDIGGGMMKTCWRWGDAIADLGAGGALATSFSLRQSSACNIGGTTGAGGPEIRDSYGNMQGLSGKVSDRCMQLQKSTTSQLGPSVYEETRTVMSSAW